MPELNKVNVAVIGRFISNWYEQRNIMPETGQSPVALQAQIKRFAIRWPWLLFVLLILLPGLTNCSINEDLEDLTTVGLALAKRWDDDDSIPTASLGFDRNYSAGERSELWLAIEISYTGHCDSSASDPCEQLADELARIAIDNYPEQSNLTGISVVIGSDPHDPYVNPADTIFEKSLVVEEWKKEFSE